MAQLATVGAVKALVYESVFSRAQDIAASDKLRAVVFQGQFLLQCKAECVGSTPTDVYVLGVSIHGASAVGECSCPAGPKAKSGLCKHAVALLLRRVQELRATAAEEQELTIPLASQVDDDGPGRDEAGITTETRHRGGTSRGAIDGQAASVRRALPAWMLGAPESAAEKPKKRAAARMPPPPPARRPVGHARSLRISNEGDDGGEDGPGEVEDAGVPVASVAIVGEEKTAPSVDDGEIAEPVPLPSAGAAARERRRLRALQKESAGVAEEEKKPRGRRSYTKAAEAPPGRARKRRRLVGKYSEDSDFSENECDLGDEGDPENGFDLTDADLMQLAQEHVESEKSAQQAEDSRPKVQAASDDAQAQDGPSRKGRKSSSIFSMSKWKEVVASQGAVAGTGEAPRSTSDDIGLEALKKVAIESSSQTSRPLDNAPLEPIESLLSSSQRLEPAPAPDNTSLPRVRESDDDADAVVNDMFKLMFGFDMNGTAPATSSAAVTKSAPNPASQHDAPTGLVSVTPSALDAVDHAPRASAPEANDDFQGRPKKKSSLRDRVKMMLG